MGEDPADHPGIRNGREQAHAPPTARTRAHVTLEGAPHEVRPRPIARRAGRLLLPLHVAARARANGTGADALPSVPWVAGFIFSLLLFMVEKATRG